MKLADMIYLKTGDKYEIVRSSSYLIYSDGTKRDLSIGDVISFVGHMKGIVYSDFTTDAFSADGSNVTGEFHPNVWGSSCKEYMRPVRENHTRR